MAESDLPRRSALTAAELRSTPGAGVWAEEIDTLAIAQLLARKGCLPQLAGSFQARCGIKLPQTPRRVTADRLAVLGVGPGAWLVTADAAPEELMEALQRSVGDCAAISDLSGAYVILRLSGPQVRATLAKLLPIDLHPRSFGIGSVSATLAAHIGVIVWRAADAEDGAIFELAVARSFASGFGRELAHSAAEFGFELRA